MANSKIPNLNLSDTLNTQRLKFNQLLDSVGDVSTLTTTAGPVTDAINELDAELGTITSGAMGTTASTVSGAIAEVDSRLDSINTTQLNSPRMTLSDAAAINTVAGKMEVSDSADFGSNVSVQGDLAVGGNTTNTGSVTIDGLLTTRANVVIGNSAGDQLYVNSSINTNVVPYTDDAFDLGSPTKEWRHVYVDGTVNADNVAADSATITGNLDVQGVTTLDSAEIVGTLDVTGVSTMDSINAEGLVAITGDLTVSDSARVSGNMSVGGSLVVGGNITANGSTLTLGDAATDNVVFNADVNSHIIPDQDDTYDLGSDGQQWRDLYVDGTANIDNVAADSATITGNLDVQGVTTLDSTSVVGTFDVTGVSEFDSANFTGAVAITGSLDVSDGFTVGGVFTTTGTIRQAESHVVLNDGVAVGNSNRSGVAVHRPGSDSAVLQWNEAGDYWEAGVVGDLNRLALQQDSAAFTNVTIGGNLVVSGTTTTVNTETINLADNIIALNSNATGAPSASTDAGIEVERGTSTNVQLLWDESEDYWVAATDGNNTLSRIATANWLDATAPISYNSTTGNISHDTSGLTAATYGQTSTEDGKYIKSITVNATGHITGITADDFDDRYDNYGSWTLQGDEGSNQTISSGDTVDIAGGTYITTTASATDTLTVAHDSTTRTNNTSTASVAHEGSTTVIDSITTNATGHVTAVNTKTVTWPAGAIPNDATITITAGTYLDNGGNFTTDQSTNETITLNHSNTTRSDTSSTDAPGYGGTFEAVTSVTTNATGHVTGIDISTVTLPSTDDTNTTYSVSIPTDTTKLRLTGSDETTDDIEFVGSGATSVVRTNDSKFTISSTDTDTTYSAGSDLDLTGTTFSLEPILDTVTQMNVSGNFTVDATGDIILDADGNDIIFKNGAGADTVTHTLADNAAFTIAAPSNYTIDAVGDITLDADGGQIYLKDGGTQRGYIDVATANTAKIYTGTSTLNTTFTGDSATVEGALTADRVRVKSNTLSGTSVTVDGSYNYYTHTLTGNTSYAFSGNWVNGIAETFIIEVTQASGPYSVSWPGTVTWDGGITPSITSTSGNTDMFMFLTADGGTSFYGWRIGEFS